MMHTNNSNSKTPDITSLFSLHPLFPGSNEVDQIAKIHDVLGTPPQSVLQKLTK